MILFLHNRYRTTGGEERVVEDLRWLVRDQLGEPEELLQRDSATLGSVAAARALLRGGVAPDEVAAAVHRTDARVLHAHNVHPAFGWRALAAARGAGARVVLHLHNYRLVCAVGTCFTDGADCTRCHARNTAPGVRHGCRGSAGEAVVYAAGLAAQQRRIVENADAIIVPSEAALARLRELGAPLDNTPVHVVAPVLREFAAGPAFDSAGPAFDSAGPALVVSRLAPEKGIDVAIDACAAAGRALVVAGDGPERAALEARAATHPGADIRFVGRQDVAELARLRARSSVALVPSRSAETFGLAAAEAMAAGLPVLVSAIGALTELAGADRAVAPGDADALAERLRAGDPGDPVAALSRARARCAPEVVASALAAVYEN